MKRFLGVIVNKFMIITVLIAAMGLQAHNGIVRISNATSKVLQVVAIATLKAQNDEERSVAQAQRIAAGCSAEFDLKKEWHNLPTNKKPSFFDWIFSNPLKSISLEKLVIVDFKGNCTELDIKERHRSIVIDEKNNEFTVR